MMGNNVISKKLKEIQEENRAQQLEADKVQKEGPKNHHWRTFFLKHWTQLEEIEANIVSAELKISIVERTMPDTKGIRLADKVADVAIEKAHLRVNRIQRMAVREELLKTLGAEWTVKSVWDVLDGYDELQGSLFRKSLEGK